MKKSSVQLSLNHSMKAPINEGSWKNQIYFSPVRNNEINPKIKTNIVHFTQFEVELLKNYIKSKNMIPDMIPDMIKEKIYEIVDSPLNDKHVVVIELTKIQKNIIHDYILKQDNIEVIEEFSFTPYQLELLERYNNISPNIPDIIKQKITHVLLEKNMKRNSNKLPSSDKFIIDLTKLQNNIILEYITKQFPFKFTKEEVGILKAYTEYKSEKKLENKNLSYIPDDIKIEIEDIISNTSNTVDIQLTRLEYDTIKSYIS